MKTLISTLLLLATAWLITMQAAVAQSADVKAIKAVIERETSSWIKRDAKAMTDCWANIPEAGQLYSAPNGVVGYHPEMPNGIKEAVAGQKPTGETFKNTNYQIRIKGDAAFAQFDQTATDPKGQKEYAHETRYLEKFGNDWKIVHVGAVYYNPTKTKTKAL